VPPALGSGQDKDESGHGKYDEIVQFGSGRSSGGRWLPRIALACLVLAAIVAVAVHGTAHHARPAAKTSPPQPVQVIGATPLPGVTGGCELFTRGPDDLVRIHLSLVRIHLAQDSRVFVRGLKRRYGGHRDRAAAGAHEVVIQSTGLCPGASCPAKARRGC
jgi:hypothetical protein